MASIEEFLRQLPFVRIVGGSPLYADLPDFSISINGLRTGAYAAAINSTESNARRASKFEHVLVPNPVRELRPKELGPADAYDLPAYFKGRPILPTTCFSLLLICQSLRLEVELFGVCGWASKYHDGDWEMHYIKTKMPNVTVHDPRPRW